MTIYLPHRPLPRSASPTPIVFGGWQTPSTGGEETWLGFMGTRLSLALQTPNLLPEPDGRLWSAALLDAWMTGAIVACAFVSPGFDPGAPGAPVIDGAGQTGMTLNLRGLTPNYVFSRRQFVSLTHGGRRYLHYATAQAIAGGDGTVALPIAPMLRFASADGDLVEAGRPLIEGKVTGDAKAFTYIPARVQSLSFTIAEVA